VALEYTPPLVTVVQPDPLFTSHKYVVAEAETTVKEVLEPKVIVLFEGLVLNVTGELTVTATLLDAALQHRVLLF
jgi:hypothetical protein